MLDRGKTCVAMLHQGQLWGCYIREKQQLCYIGENHSSVVTSEKTTGRLHRGGGGGGENHGEVTSDKNTAMSKPAEMSHRA